MSSVRRSLTFSLADSYLGVVLQMASTLIVSRLLTPQEIGIFSVAAVLAAMASTFRDFGVAEYLIQEKQLTAAKIRAAFAANILVSWLMALLLFGSSGWVAEFYRHPGVADVMRIQSINFLLIPFGAVTMAYCRRELNYRPIFIAGLLSNITSFLVATGGALAGFGYLSLAWSSLAGVVVTVLVSLFARPVGFPRWPSFAGMAEVAHFGKHASGIYLFGQIGKGAPEAIIGRALDIVSVAYFSRANGLMEIFNRTVMRAVVPVCLPYFSQAARAGQGTRLGYMQTASLLTGVGWPFFACIGVLAFCAIRIIYGPQWVPSVPLAQILCLAAILDLPYYLATEVMIAEGRIDQSNRLQLLVQSTTLLGLTLVLPFGLAGACWGLVAASLCNLLTKHRFLRRIIGLGLADIWRACLPSAGVTLLTVLPAGLMVAFVPPTESNYAEVFSSAGVLCLLAWLLGLQRFRHPLWPEISAGAARLGGVFRKALQR